MNNSNRNTFINLFTFFFSSFSFSTLSDAEPACTERSALFIFFIIIWIRIMYLFIIIIPILLGFHLVFWSFSLASRSYCCQLPLLLPVSLILIWFAHGVAQLRVCVCVCEWICECNAVCSKRYILHISIVIIFFAFHKNEKDFQYNISMQHPHMQYQWPKVIVERAVDFIPMDLMNRFVLRKINLSYQRRCCCCRR